MFTKEGLLIGKKARASLKDVFEKEKKILEQDNVLQAITSVVESTIARISKETGSFGTATFETTEHRLVFNEAGEKAVLLCVFDFEASHQTLLPYVFLISEKVSAILENRLTEFHSLEIPMLELGHSLDFLKPELFTESGYKYMPQEKRFKLVLIGDKKVGKTTTINKFVLKKFIADYRPTLGISITHQKYYINGLPTAEVNFQIWDLAGQEFFKRIRKHYYKGAHAVFIMYDVTDKDSFIHVDDWYNDIMSELPNIPAILIGNKIDLEGERVVSIADGKQKAQKLRMTFIETSAKTGANIRDLFSILGIGLFFTEQH